jgi:hypothetical protein
MLPVSIQSCLVNFPRRRPAGGHIGAAATTADAGILLPPLLLAGALTARSLGVADLVAGVGHGRLVVLLKTLTSEERCTYWMPEWM